MTDPTSKSLREVIDELPAKGRALARESTEYLHGLPPRPAEPDESPEPGTKRAR